MFIYTIINLIILVVAYMSYNLCKKLRPIQEETNTKIDYTNTKFFLFCVLVILVVVTGLRGHFTVDYAIYYNLFDRVQEMSLLEILQGNINVEVGYALINKLVGYFFNDCVFLMVVLAFITVVSYLKVFRKYSKSVWISVILLLCIGSYYTSFNTTRIALAAALIFLSAKYLYEKKDWWCYFICIVLISTIHKSALIMIPLYFVLQYRTFAPKNRKYLFLIIPALLVFFVFGRTMINTLASIFYPSYVEEGYGMDWGNSLVTLFRPIVIMIFLWINRQYIDFTDKKQMIWVNGTILFFIISVLSCNIRILYRFYYYVLPFVLLLIPNILSKMPKYKRRRWTLVVILAAIGYLLISNILNDEVYYFIWQYQLFDY